MSLINALKSHNASVVETVCASGASPNEVENGVAPMHIAVGIQSKKAYTLTSILLQYGGDPNVPSDERLTPVHVAVIWNKSSILQLLLNNGGDPFLKDEEGSDAWDIASGYKHRDCLGVLNFYRDEIRSPFRSPPSSGDEAQKFTSIFRRNIPIDRRSLLSGSFNISSLTNSACFDNDRKSINNRLSSGSTASTASRCYQISEMNRAFISSSLSSCTSRTSRDETLNGSSNRSSTERTESVCLPNNSFTPPRISRSPTINTDLTPVPPPRRRSKNSVGPFQHSPRHAAEQSATRRSVIKMIRAHSESPNCKSTAVRPGLEDRPGTNSADTTDGKAPRPSLFIGDRLADSPKSSTKRSSLRNKLNRVLRRCNSTPAKLVSFSLNGANTNSNLHSPQCTSCTYNDEQLQSPCNVHAPQLPDSPPKSTRRQSISKIFNKLHLSPSKFKSKDLKSSPSAKVAPPPKPRRSSISHNTCTSPRNGKLGAISVKTTPTLNPESQSPEYYHGMTESDLHLLMSGQAILDITSPDHCVVTPVNRASIQQSPLDECDRTTPVTNLHGKKTPPTFKHNLLRALSKKASAHKLIETPMRVRSKTGKEKVIDPEKLTSIEIGDSVFDVTSPDHPVVVECNSDKVNSARNRLDYTITEELNEELERLVAEATDEESRRVCPARKSLFASQLVSSETQTPFDEPDSSLMSPLSTQVHHVHHCYCCNGAKPHSSSTQDCAVQISPGAVTHNSTSQDSGIESIPINKKPPSAHNQPIKHRFGPLNERQRFQSGNSESSFHTCLSVEDTTDDPIPRQNAAADLPTETDTLAAKVSRMNITVGLDSPNSVIYSSPDPAPLNDIALSIAEYIHTDLESNVSLSEHHLPTLADSTIILELDPEASILTELSTSLGWKSIRELDEISVDTISAERSLIPSDWIKSLSDADLRIALIKYGVSPGPITPVTRTLYELKLERIKSDPDLQQNSIQTAGYSVELKEFMMGHPSISPDHLVELEQKLIGQFDERNSADTGTKWREGNSKMSFTYLLLDPRTTKNLPARHHAMEQDKPGSSFQAFLSSVFYIGKGKKTRPYQHFIDAIRHRGSNSTKTRQIDQIWASGLGVVSVHVFHNMIPVEAYTREAAMVDALGISNLTNIAKCNYYGLAGTWSPRQQRLLGASLLYKAFQIYLIEGERQLRPTDVRQASDNS